VDGVHEKRPLDRAAGGGLHIARIWCSYGTRNRFPGRFKAAVIMCMYMHMGIRPIRAWHRGVMSIAFRIRTRVSADPTNIFSRATARAPVPTATIPRPSSRKQKTRATGARAVAF
jgi:hypothetical protein